MKRIFTLIRYDWPLHFVLLFTNWLPDNVLFIRLRGKLASPFLKKCGKNLGLGRNVTLYNPSKIEFGNDVYVAYGCWFSPYESIILEDEVMLGPYVVIAGSNHTKINGSFRFGEPKGGEIRIGKGSWVGAQSTILKGVNIGKGSCVGTQSVVNKSVNDNTIVAGNPARLIKNI